MVPMHTPSPRNRSTFGEALIVIAVIAGFFWTFSQNRIVPQDLWMYAAFLGGIVAFYFALLFARMLFFWMTGGDYNFSWGDWQEWQRAENARWTSGQSAGQAKHQGSPQHGHGKKK